MQYLQGTGKSEKAQTKKGLTQERDKLSKHFDFKDLSRNEIENLIDQWILNERDRKILKRRLLDGIRFEPLAEEFRLSTQRTKSIVYKGIQRLINHI